MSGVKNPPVSAGTRPARPALFYGYIIVACSFVVLLVVFGTNYSFGIFFNRLLADLEWSRTVISTGYSIAQFLAGVVGILTGRLSDRFGPRFTVLACGIALALGCFLMSLVTQPWMLYFFYGLLVGIGFGGAGIPVSSTIPRWFVRRRGLMTGIVVAGIGCGTIIMPLLVNLLLENNDWRKSFVILAVIVTIAIIPVTLFLKRDPSEIGTKAYGDSSSGHPGSVRKEEGLTLKQAIRTRSFWIVALVFIIFGFYVQSIMVHVVPYARSLGIEAGSAAAIMSFLGIGSITGRIVMGTLSDRLGVKRTVIIALSVLLAAYLLLRSANVLWMLYVFAVMFGFGYGAMISMQNLIPARFFGLLSIGTMVGVITFIYAIGGALGPVVTGYVFDVTHSYNLAFIIYIVLAAAGILCALTLKTPSPQRKD